MGLDHCMHGVFRVVFGCVFHVCDCVIVCYTLRGKLIYSMMYIGRSGMLRLGTITLRVRKMK